MNSRSNDQLNSTKAASKAVIDLASIQGALEMTGNHHSRPEVLSGPPKPTDLMHALRRRWGWTLIVGTLCAALAAVGMWQVIKVNYTATAWLRIFSSQPHVLYNVDQGESLLDERGVQAAMLTSPMVLKAVLANPEIAQLATIQDEKDPEAWLRTHLRVSFPGTGDVMQVTMTGEVPRDLSEIVNASVNAYMTEIVEKERTERLAKRGKLQAIYEDYLAQLEAKKGLYKSIANTFGASGSDTMRIKTLHELESVDSLRDRVNELNGTIGGQETRLSIYNAQLALATGIQEEASEGESVAGRPVISEEKIQQAAEMLVARDDWIMNATVSIQEYEQAIITESHLAAQGENAPSVARLRERKETLEQHIVARREQLLPQAVEMIRTQIADGVVGAPRSPLDDIRAAIVATELEKSVLEREKEVAMATWEQAAKESEKLGQSSAELENSRADVERMQSLVDQLATELQEWEIEKDAAPRVEVLQEASVPQTSDAASKWQKTALTALVSFGAIVVLFAGLDFFSRRVNSSTEIACGLGVDVIGDLPMISAGGRRERKALINEDSSLVRGVYVESVDKVRTSLLHRADVEGVQVVFVTSATAKEGKSTLASQLSGSLARSGRRTLLIDGDLRRPTQHRVFGLPNGPGLSEHLRGEIDLAEAVQETRVSGLSVLTAGYSSVEVLQSLTQDNLRDAVEQLKQEYDFIIIDSGPVLADADSLLIARAADAVLLSVRQDISRMPRVYEAIQRLASVDLPLLGVVVSGVSAVRYRSYYRPHKADKPRQSITA